MTKLLDISAIYPYTKTMYKYIVVHRYSGANGNVGVFRFAEGQQPRQTLPTKCLKHAQLLLIPQCLTDRPGVPDLEEQPSLVIEDFTVAAFPPTLVLKKLRRYRLLQSFPFRWR